ncbi:MAG: hypothetical protein KA419_14690 [Acidobacteria bacterium]|nr:hypothetical protein [Acidobacteriota bacterium]
MANITLSVDSELIRAARKIAIDRDSSLNELVRRFLVDLVAREASRRALLAEELDGLFRQGQGRVGKKTWTREDLHER